MARKKRAVYKITLRKGKKRTSFKAGGSHVYYKSGKSVGNGWKVSSKKRIKKPSFFERNFSG